MFEANCLEEAPAGIVARVLQEKTPCFVTAREGERGVLLPLDDVYAEVLEAHSRVLDAWVSDLEQPGPDMALYCVQVSLSDEHDAIRFLDEAGNAVLALVGALRFLRWLEDVEAPSSEEA